MKITLKNGVEVSIPEVYGYFKCRGCGADDLIWAATKAGKSMPVHWTAEGWTCHFEDCPNACKFRKKKKL